MPKYVPESTLLGRQGVTSVELVVIEMKHVWNSTTVDSGIDGVIEFRDRDTGAMTNTIVQVQIKTGDSYFRAETDDEFTFYADTEDLEHWRRSNTPVIVVTCRPGKDAYWIDVKRDDVIDRSGKKPKILFRKATTQFDVNCEPALRALAVPKPWGFHFRPKRLKESLTLNFMPLRFPVNAVYVADTELRDAWEVIDSVKACGGSRDRAGEFVLAGGKIYNVEDLRDGIFAKTCDQATVEKENFETWLDEQPSLGLDLMHRMLRQICWDRYVEWRQHDEVFFFQPTEDGTPRTARVEGKRVSHPTVYKQYLSKKDPTRVSYHRHQAFEAQFQQVEAKWYLVVSPTFVFTSNGWRKHPFHEEYLKKINELEGPPAIFSHLKMWASVLQPIHELGARNYPHMELGPLATFEMERGIDDKAWKPTAQNEDEAVAASETADLGLDL